MEGREPKKENDLFYLCSLIEYIGRATRNHNRVVVNALGEERLKKILSLADVYHSDNIDRVAHDFIEECGISQGGFDITDVDFGVPTYWDIGKVYKRLIVKVSEGNARKFIPTLKAVYNSWIADYIDNYNTSFYYDSSDCHYKSYLYGDDVG